MQKQQLGAAVLVILVMRLGGIVLFGLFGSLIML
jgi:hypothetical protein